MKVNLLHDRVIGVRQLDAVQVECSLPDLYAALAADRVASFAALRPHQRHSWHALMSQLGAIACLEAGRDEPPADAADWAAVLRALTPEFPDDEPWSLVAPPDKPAFLQPVVGPLNALKPLDTPDELDMLVTAKNHDIKGARMARAKADDWLFALVALQTGEGFLGAGNFGISRMNGGFANRPGVGLAPQGGVGAHVFRDIRRLIALRDSIVDKYPEYDAAGPALVWLTPWDGTASMPRIGLHPYYIEVCRRVRLVDEGGVISARAGNSKAARIAMTKAEAGITGDPWTPIDRRSGDGKALTVDARGFDYRRLSDILFQAGYEPAPLQVFGPEERGKDWSLLCRAMARGQGKTEGYHERRVMLPAPIVGRIKAGEITAIEAISKDRITQAAAVRSALWRGLMVLLQNGPEHSDFDARDPSSSRHAERPLGLFQAVVDADFFEALFAEASESSQAAQRDCRITWLKYLRSRALYILKDAAAASPGSATRRHRAIVRAESSFDRAFYYGKDLRVYFERVADVA